MLENIAMLAVVKSHPRKATEAKMSVYSPAKVTANYKRHVASGLVGVAATKCGMAWCTLDSSVLFVCAIKFTTILKCQQQQQRQQQRQQPGQQQKNNRSNNSINIKRQAIHMSDNTYQPRSATDNKR